MAMQIAGHLTEEMHHHYAPVDAVEKQTAARNAFGGLRVLRGGLSDRVQFKTGAQTGDRKECG